MSTSAHALLSIISPSTSASCYASIHTGVTPQVHGVTGNNTVFKVAQPDIFSAVAAADGTNGAVAHSFWSEFFQRAPFEPISDVEYDEEAGPIHHGRFHAMTGYGAANQMTPADCDLFASLSNLCQRFDLDYGMLHTCTLDCMGHRFGHDCTAMDHAWFVMDEQLAPYIWLWREMGYQITVTADHGQTDRGHHGGSTNLMRDAPLYYFGPAKFKDSDLPLGQLQLAPTLLSLLGAGVPASMQADVFLTA